MWFTNFEAQSNEVEDFPWPEVKQLKLIVAFLNLTVFYFGQSAFGHSIVKLMLMFDIALSQHKLAVRDIVKLQKGQTSPNFAFEQIPSLCLSSY
jgi:hypothetical protein